ncbi:hypothetical protein ACFRI7_08665 [Streptomyces sp. NPDC056716]|uniref:hypothetical protein n=1 Tax=unclassified Streptomyces TaxID=2593676 RepID=UPI00369E8271
MRLVTPAALCLAAVAVLFPAPPTRAAAPAPICGDPGGRDFPLTTRIHGGPGSYAAGGAPGTWYVDVTNTTDRTCSGIHPVVVLVDEERKLTAAQPRLEFHDGGRAHTVRFETTDADELVAPFEARDFAGLTVGAGRTARVTVRLSVTADTAPNDITATAAVVQRQRDDGDWVGQSNAYRFHVVRTGETADSGGAEAGPGTPPTPAPPTPSPTPTASPGTRTTLADELASTGLGTPGQALALALAFVAGGCALLLARRRR